MHFGVHISTGGNLATAPVRGQAIGCKTMQIFSGNPRGWTKPALDPKQVEAFRRAVAETCMDPVVVHATYLINLAAPDRDIYRKSIHAFIDELRRSKALGATYYVVHCGSHKGTGEVGGRERIIEALRRAAEEVPDGPTVLLENTAGTANSLGTTFEDLAVLLDGANLPKLGLCFDTCHALAAGYEIRSVGGLKKSMDQLSSTVGFSRLHLLHINDSKGDLGSRLDRHEHIGAGHIGRVGFKVFFSEPRIRHLPAILETPVDTPEDDHSNLWRAAELALAGGAVPFDYLEFMPTALLAPILPKSEKATGDKAGKATVPSNVAKGKQGKSTITKVKRRTAGQKSTAKPVKKKGARRITGLGAGKKKRRRKN